MSHSLKVSYVASNSQLCFSRLSVRLHLAFEDTWIPMHCKKATYFSGNTATIWAVICLPYSFSRSNQDRGVFYMRYLYLFIFKFVLLLGRNKIWKKNLNCLPCNNEKKQKKHHSVYCGWNHEHYMYLISPQAVFSTLYPIHNWVHYGSDIFRPDLLSWGSGFDCSGSSPQDFSSHHGQIVSTDRRHLASENVIFENL